MSNEPLGVSDDARSAARGSIALAFGQMSTRSLQLAFVLVTARVVAPDQFGRYSIATALLLFGAFIGDFGTSRFITRAVSRNRAQSDEILASTALGSAGLGLIGMTSIGAFAAMAYDRTTAVDVLIAGASLPATAMATSFSAALDGAGKFPARTLANISQALVAAGGGALAVVFTDDIRWAIASVPAGAAVGLTVAYLSVRRAGLLHTRLTTDLPRLLSLLRSSIPFAIFAGLGALSARFDVTLLSIIEGAAAAASYDVALRATESLWYLHTLITGPTMFLLSRRLGASDTHGAQRAYSQAIRVSYLAGLPFSALLFGLHEPIVRVLGDQAYGEAADALSLLGAGLFLTFVALVQGTAILSGDDHGRGVAVAASVTVITVGLDSVLITRYGLRGAAIAALVTSGVTCVAFAAFIERTQGIRTPLPHFGALAGAASAAAISRHFAAEPVRAGLGAFSLYVVLTVATGAASRADLKQFRRMVQRPAR